MNPLNHRSIYLFKIHFFVVFSYPYYMCEPYCNIQSSKTGFMSCSLRYLMDVWWVFLRFMDVVEQNMSSFIHSVYLQGPMECNILNQFNYVFHLNG